MNIFGLTVRRLQKSLATLAGVSGARAWWPFIHETSAGAWQRNEEVNVASVLSNPTLYACITLIAGDISKLRPKLVEQDANGIWTETESPAFTPFLRKPNHYQTRIGFFEWWQLSLLCHGNTYAMKARDGRSVVRAAYILDPTRVTPLVSDDGSVFYQLRADNLSGIKSDIIVPAREMFHDIECPLFHPLVGVSPIFAAGYPALHGLTTRSASRLFFATGSRPGGVLTAPGPISQETAKRAKDYWDNNFSGDNIGKVAVLGDGLKYEAMAVTAEQSQLVEQLRMTDEDIAKCFHMPRHKMGIGADPTYNNIEALNQGYYSDCLQKRIEKMELCLDEGLELTSVPGKTLGVELDLDDLLRMDTAALITAEKAADGIKTPNESRRRMNLPPIKGGDTVYKQHQDYPIEVIFARKDVQTGTPDVAPTPAPDEPSEDEKALTLVEFAQMRDSFSKAWERTA